MVGLIETPRAKTRESSMQLKAAPAGCFKKPIPNHLKILGQNLKNVSDPIMYPSLTPQPAKKNLNKQSFATIESHKNLEIISNIP